MSMPSSSYGHMISDAAGAKSCMLTHVLELLNHVFFVNALSTGMYWDGVA
jgi:hypothetical protein